MAPTWSVKTMKITDIVNVRGVDSFKKVALLFFTLQIAPKWRLRTQYGGAKMT